MIKKLFAVSAVIALIFCSCGKMENGKSGDDGDFDSVVVTAEFDTEVTIMDISGVSTTYTTDFSALDVDYFYGFKADGSDAKYVKITQQKNSVKITVPVTSSSATLYGGIRYTLKSGFDKSRAVGLARYFAGVSYECYKSGSLVSQPKGSISLSDWPMTGSNYDLNDENDLKKFNSFISRSNSPRAICEINK